MASTFGKSKRIQTDDEDLDITPMIDVTFLLLIFFMVTSNMKQSATVNIPRAKHGESVPTSQAVILTIFKTDGDPEVYLSDGTKDNGPVGMEEVTAYVSAGVADGKKYIIIKADKDLPSGFVEEVARAANEVDDTELTFFIGIIDKK
ncbi:ExbD/TolR family protein [Thalassoglobus polymorphus]|uniref:Colicin uptake protein TolR n=1 Tax=Thalassoglobus polymorphus TaxID=2527994 RepID=A0A517QTW8_9PLAN|nr:biopolymer transporter ExbD [Thalassoglobus polymorphus]QDT35076.1 colicin uptake protein TolR [Thalassoglobus polymorphus]